MAHDRVNGKCGYHRTGEARDTHPRSRAAASQTAVARTVGGHLSTIVRQLIEDGASLQNTAVALRPGGMNKRSRFSRNRPGRLREGAARSIGPLRVLILQQSQ